MAVLREVDKIDKRGADYVRDTLMGEGFNLPAERVAKILEFIAVRSNGHADALAQQVFSGDPPGRALAAYARALDWLMDEDRALEAAA